MQSVLLLFNYLVFHFLLFFMHYLKLPVINSK